MSIRIRVYPQPHSIGARRNRARRQQQQLIRQSFNWQQQLIRDRIRQQAMFGFGGMGFGPGFGSGIGQFPAPGSPGASSWGYVAPPAFGGYGSAWSGAYALPGSAYAGSYGSSYGASYGYGSSYGSPYVPSYAGSSSYGC